MGRPKLEVGAIKPAQQAVAVGQSDHTATLQFRATASPTGSALLNMTGRGWTLARLGGANGETHPAALTHASPGHQQTQPLTTQLAMSGDLGIRDPGRLCRLAGHIKQRDPQP